MGDAGAGEPTAYDRQLERAWKGDYSAGGGCPKGLSSGWKTPEAAEKQDRAQAWDKCRREMETIVERETVPLADGRMEGRMKLAKFVKFREEKFGGVLFETRNEKVYTLNPTGAAVVREIVGGAADVVGALKERFDDKDGRIEAEARAFLEDLKTKGLVEA